MKVVIVGGVAAGMSAATRLRRLNELAEITVYEMGEHVSYANCGLPYFVSGVIADREKLLLQTPESIKNRFNVNVLTRHRVDSIDPERRVVNVTNLSNGITFQDSYDHLVLATGAKPRVPNLPGAERGLVLRDVHDLDQLVQNLESKKPVSAAVIGGGFIGIELAENLARLGIQVSIIQKGKSLMGTFDLEMVEPLHEHLEKNDVRLHLGAEISEIRDTDVLLSDGTLVAGESVFFAAGVEPDVTLALRAGLKLADHGGILVDKDQRTSQPEIFAAGDAAAKRSLFDSSDELLPLANLANRHGRLIADAIMGVPTHARESSGTAILSAFGLAIAKTGLSEKQAISKGLDIGVVHLHPFSHATYYPGAERLALKVIFDRHSGKLLGAQATGQDGVDKRIDVISTAIYAGLEINDLMNLELAYAPQFGSAKDAVNQAGFVGNNLIEGKTPNLQWHELESFMSGDGLLIDVRTRSERDAGYIEGSVNIPLDELRSQVNTLTGKSVVVHCQVGQRGHTAVRLLRESGIQAKNLDGGFITWKAGTDASRRKKEKNNVFKSQL